MPPRNEQEFQQKKTNETLTDIKHSWSEYLFLSRKERDRVEAREKKFESIMDRYERALSKFNINIEKFTDKLEIEQKARNQILSNMKQNEHILTSYLENLKKSQEASFRLLSKSQQESGIGKKLGRSIEFLNDSIFDLKDAIEKGNFADISEIITEAFKSMGSNVDKEAPKIITELSKQMKELDKTDLRISDIERRIEASKSGKDSIQYKHDDELQKKDHSFWTNNFINVNNKFTSELEDVFSEQLETLHIIRDGFQTLFKFSKGFLDLSKNIFGLMKREKIRKRTTSVAGGLGALGEGETLGGEAGGILGDLGSTYAAFEILKKAGKWLKFGGLSKIMKIGNIAAGGYAVFKTFEGLQGFSSSTSKEELDAAKKNIGYGIGSGIGALLGSIGGPVGVFIGMQIGGLAGEYIGEFWDPIKAGIESMMNSTKEFFKKADEYIKANYPTVWKGIETLNNILPSWSDVGSLFSSDKKADNQTTNDLPPSLPDQITTPKDLTFSDPNKKSDDGIGNFLNKIFPKFAGGGITKGNGLAMLHKNEVIFGLNDFIYIMYDLQDKNWTFFKEDFLDALFNKFQKDFIDNEVLKRVIADGVSAGSTIAAFGGIPQKSAQLKTPETNIPSAQPKTPETNMPAELQQRLQALPKMYTPPVKISQTIGEVLGSLSAKYESGGRGVGTISSGIGDAGGKSYGVHQLSSNAGTLAKFLDTSGYASQFAGMSIGSSEFDSKWKELAKNDPNFGPAQTDFLKKTHYDPAAEYASKLGFDMNNKAIQESIFSGSIQHGGIKKILGVAASTNPDFSKLSPEDQINAFYNARTNYVKGFNVPFAAGEGRYIRERADALGLAGKLREQGINGDMAGVSQEITNLETEAQKIKANNEMSNFQSMNNLNSQLQNANGALGNVNKNLSSVNSNLVPLPGLMTQTGGPMVPEVNDELDAIGILMLNRVWA